MHEIKFYINYTKGLGEAGKSPPEPQDKMLLDHQGTAEKDCWLEILDCCQGQSTTEVTLCVPDREAHKYLSPTQQPHFKSTKATQLHSSH